jgi:hypothetical protein
MKHRLRAAALALLLLPTAGCGDSFGSLFHEMLATYNEMADNMLFVCDEDTAEAFTNLRMSKITKRWQKITQRAQEWLKRTDFNDNPKVRYELTNLFIDYSDEYVSVMDRLKEQYERLEQIRIKIYIGRYGQFHKTADLDVECPQITKVMKAAQQLALKDLLPMNALDPGAINGNILAPANGEAAPAINFPVPPNIQMPR